VALSDIHVPQTSTPDVYEAVNPQSFPAVMFSFLGAVIRFAAGPVVLLMFAGRLAESPRAEYSVSA